MSGAGTDGTAPWYVGMDGTGLLKVGTGGTYPLQQSAHAGRRIDSGDVRSPAGQLERRTPSACSGIDDACAGLEAKSINSLPSQSQRNRFKHALVQGNMTVPKLGLLVRLE